MENIPYVIKLLETRCGVKAREQDFGYESIVLDRKELDLSLLPRYFDEIQTDQEVLVHYYLFENYLVYIIADIHNKAWLLVGIVKDDQLIYSAIPAY